MMETAFSKHLFFIIIFKYCVAVFLRTIFCTYTMLKPPHLLTASKCVLWGFFQFQVDEYQPLRVHNTNGEDTGYERRG